MQRFWGDACSVKGSRDIEGGGKQRHFSPRSFSQGLQAAVGALGEEEG